MVDACGSLSLPAAMMAGVYLDVFDVLCAVLCEGLAGSTVLGVGICEGCFAMRSWIESRQSALDPCARWMGCACASMSYSEQRGSKSWRACGTRRYLVACGNSAP
jgi:hypothetical protein